MIFISGCNSNSTTYNTFNSNKKILKPSWINDSFVGVARITASGNKTEQKQIAIKRAIAILLITKGTSQGNSNIFVQKELSKRNNIENFYKYFSQNSTIRINFKNINYNIKVTNIWQDPYTKELYVKIEEK